MTSFGTRQVAKALGGDSLLYLEIVLRMVALV